MAELEIRLPDGTVETAMLLKGKSLRIGSAEHMDIMLPGDDILDQHCVIRSTKNGFELHLSEGADNVTVNDEFVESTTLQDGDQIGIGDFVIVLVDSPRAQAQEQAIEVAAAMYTPTYRSPTFIIAAVALGVVILAALVFTYLYQDVKSRNMFTDALAAIEKSEWTKAAELFQEFIDSFPYDSDVPEARVRLGIAQVRQYASGSNRSWSKAHEALFDMLEKTRALEYFKNPDITKEIQTLFGEIVAGYYEEAKTQFDRQKLDKGKEVLTKLTEIYAPEDHPKDLLARLQTLYSEADAAIVRNDRRLKALADMEKALTARKPIEVFNIHRALYQSYPELQKPTTREDRKFLELREQARALELQLITFQPASGQDLGGTAKREEKAPARTTVQHKAGDQAKSANKLLFPVVADAVYALDAGNGKPSWNLSIGYNPAFPPFTLPKDPDKLLLHRSHDNTLVLLRASSGEPIWERSLGQRQLPFGTRPAVLGSELYLLSQDAKGNTGDPTGGILTFALTDGSFLGEFILPQRALAWPNADVERNMLLILGEQVSLYTIAPQTRKGERVDHLDHEPGTIKAPPVLTGPYFFTVQNIGTDRAEMVGYAIDPNNGQLRRRQELKLDGILQHAPVAVAGRLMITTDREQFYVFDLKDNLSLDPFALAAETAQQFVSGSTQPYAVPEWGSVDEARHIWTVGKQLRFFELNLGEKKVAPTHELPLSGLPTQRPNFLANTLVVILDDKQTGGITVVGYQRPRTGRTPPTEVWRTQLAIQPLGVQVDPESPDALLVTTEVNTYQLAGAELERPSIQMEAVPRLESRERVDQSQFQPVPGWSEGVLQWPGKGGKALLLIQQEQTRKLALPSPIAAQPAIFGNGVLVPALDGYLYWIDLNTGGEICDPLVAPYRDGQPLPLLAVTASNATTALVIAGERLLKVELADQPYPHLRTIDEQVFSQGTITSALILDNRLLITQRPVFETITVEEKNEIELKQRAPARVQVIDPDRLDILQTIPLSDPVSTAPIPTTSGFLLISERHQVQSFKKSGEKYEPTWQSNLPSAPLQSPQLRDGTLWVAFANGQVQALDLASGKVRDTRQTGRGLRRGPFVMEQRLVFLTPDGSLCSIAIPTTTAAANNANR